jgi:hypothetical protein
MIEMSMNGMTTFFTVVGKLKKEIAGVETKLLKKSANDYVKALRRNIDDQTFGDFGFPLSKKWVQRKARGGFDADVWSWKGYLYKAIKAKPVGKEEWEAGIGYYPGKTGKNDPRYYATVVETGKQPGGHPRPLFAKTRVAFKKEWNKNCGEIINTIKQVLK